MRLLALLVVTALACQKGLKSFTAAMVSGYMGADAFVPKECYDQLNINSLEELTIRAVTNFVKGSEDVESTLQSLATEVKDILHACGIDTCTVDLGSSTEQLRLLINFVTTLPKGTEILGNVANAASSYQWGEMGYSLGEYIKLVKDGDVAGQLFDALLGPFVKGIVLGLERRKSETHACYEEVRHFPQYLVPAIEAAYYSFLLDDRSKYEALLGSLGDKLEKAQATCKVQKLMDFVGKIRASDMMGVGTQVMMNLQELKEAAATVVNTWGADWEECGLSLGKMVRLITGWSV